MSTINTGEYYCINHGLTKWVQRPNGKWSCSKCASRQVANRRIVRRKELVELYGAACVVCGYSKCTDALQFHHRDPATKLFELGRNNMNKRWNEILAEAAKCDLLCANCHAEVHERERIDQGIEHDLDMELSMNRITPGD